MAGRWPGRWPSYPVDETVADSAGAVELGMLLDLLDADQRQAFVLTQLIGLSYCR
jgi:DNA-directed RNA polymerase specialized sigma24 family protein